MAADPAAYVQLVPGGVCVVSAAAVAPLFAFSVVVME
jgi:hypothetical protein